MDNDVVGALRTLSVRELAKAIGIQSWRVYAMITDGTAPPFIRIGRTYRFRVRDVDAWMDKQSNPKEA